MRTDDTGAGPRIRSASYPLSGRSGTAPRARDHARGFLRSRTPPLAASVVDDALIVAGELISNAVRHAPGPCVLHLADDGKQLTIAVSDTSDRLPVPRHPDLATGSGGFGWHLLHRLGGGLNVRTGPGPGKTVTVTIDVEE